MSSTFKITEHTIPGQHLREYPMSTKTRQEDVFRIAIKQYVPLKRTDPVPEDAVTILGFHGNGFPKETYEPLFEDLYAVLEARGIHVRGIWLSDSSNQAASGVLNESIQGDQTGWFDHSRDVLHMVNHFREEMPRPIIGLAHSYGCAQLVHLSTLHPRLLSSVILIEPVIFDPYDPAQWHGNAPHPAAFTSIRRDLWPSREAAAKSLSKAFSYWDPRSLAAYIKYNLRPVPTAVYNDVSQKDETKTQNPSVDQKANQQSTPVITPESVTLTTSKAQESWTYSTLNLFPPIYDPSDADNKRWNHLIRPDQSAINDWSVSSTRPECAITMQELTQLRPDALFIYGQNSPMHPPSSREIKHRTTGTRQGGSGGVEHQGRVKSVVIPRASHLVPFEKHSLPGLVQTCADFVCEWFNRWKEDEELMRTYLARRDSKQSDPDRLKVSQEWLVVVKGGVGVKKPTAGDVVAGVGIEGGKAKL